MGEIIMEKKYIYLLIVLCLLMIYIIYIIVGTDKESGVVIKQDSSEIDEKESTTYGKALEQYDGVIINDRLMTAFNKKYGVRDGKTERYPDNFAGTYINDNGKLVIQISRDIDTKLLNEEYSSYVDIKNIKNNDESFKANKLSDVVVYEKAEYSLNQLHEMMDNAVNILNEHFTVMGNYVDTFNNMIVLEIEQGEFDKIENIDDIIDKYFEKDAPLIIKPGEITELDSN